ncbi:BlaI/MecI/CopY family transcriptional regulator [Bradyrhizobium oligotrophicum]|uniref:BlaI/MecI/CopY family transcriptional regulator n=1 Tax=Bradyrhizobium oligotrophicum TaxID=44255 RepID=UPI003EBE253A
MEQELPDMSDLERDVMNLVWERQPITAELVRERLDRDFKDSTVRTLLRRLEEKGYVSHAVDGRTYVYSARRPPEVVAANAVNKIVNWFCRGSVEDLLVGMIDEKLIDKRQLKAFADRIARSKSGER